MSNSREGERRSYIYFSLLRMPLFKPPNRSRPGWNSLVCFVCSGPGQENLTGFVVPPLWRGTGLCLLPDPSAPIIWALSPQTRILGRKISNANTTVQPLCSYFSSHSQPLGLSHLKTLYLFILGFGICIYISCLSISSETVCAIRQLGKRKQRGIRKSRFRLTLLLMLWG